MMWLCCSVNVVMPYKFFEKRSASTAERLSPDDPTPGDTRCSFTPVLRRRREVGIPRNCLDNVSRCLSGDRYRRFCMGCETTIKICEVCIHFYHFARIKRSP